MTLSLLYFQSYLIIIRFWPDVSPKITSTYSSFSTLQSQFHTSGDVFTYVLKMQICQEFRLINIKLIFFYSKTSVFPKSQLFLSMHFKLKYVLDSEKKILQNNQNINTQENYI